MRTFFRILAVTALIVVLAGCTASQNNQNSIGSVNELPVLDSNNTEAFQNEEDLQKVISELEQTGNSVDSSMPDVMDTDLQ